MSVNWSGVAITAVNRQGKGPLTFDITDITAGIQLLVAIGVAQDSPQPVVYNSGSLPPRPIQPGTIFVTHLPGAGPHTITIPGGDTTTFGLNYAVA
jgi:hypothetical protein